MGKTPRPGEASGAGRSPSVFPPHPRKGQSPSRVKCVDLVGEERGPQPLPGPHETYGLSGPVGGRGGSVGGGWGGEGRAHETEGCRRGERRKRATQTTSVSHRRCRRPPPPDYENLLVLQGTAQILPVAGGHLPTPSLLRDRTPTHLRLAHGHSPEPRGVSHGTKPTFPKGLFLPCISAPISTNSFPKFPLRPASPRPARAHCPPPRLMSPPVLRGVSPIAQALLSTESQRRVDCAPNVCCRACVWDRRPMWGRKDVRVSHCSS